MLIFYSKVFSNNTFHFLGVLSKNVPVLSCGGISKRFICPGWRLGWIVLHDRQNLFKGREFETKKNEKNDVWSLDTIKPGLIDLSSRILGPNSVTQAALPHILSETPDSYYEDILHQLQVKIFIKIHLFN
jgi:tyrosine aminotransferase